MITINKLPVLELASFLYITLLNKKSSTYGHDCVEIKVALGYSGVNCRNTTQIVPQDLSPDIQVLGFSDTSFFNLTGSVFVRYSKLKVLYMVGLVIEGSMDFYIFRPLTELRTLQYVNNRYSSSGFNFYIPSSLDVLFLSYNYYITNPDLKNNTKLRVLYMNDCAVTRFPNLSINAPLREMYLENNRLLQNLSIEEIAPFCLLKKLYISGMDLPLTRIKDQYCECAKLERWLMLCGINEKHFIPFNCTTNPEKGLNYPEQCNLTFSQKARDLHDECRRKHHLPSISYELNTSFRMNTIFLIILIVILTVLILVCVIYLFYFKRMETENKGDWEEDSD